MATTKRGREWPPGRRRERGGTGGEFPPEHRDVVAVGDEADLLTLGLLGGGERESPGGRARLGLRERADGHAHPPHDIAADPPQEVRLVLGAVGAAEEAAPLRAGVVPRGDGVAAEGVGVGEEVAELRKGVAAHAGDGRAAAGVFRHEVGDDIAAEVVLEVEDIVRDAQPRGHGLRVADRVEGAAGAVGNGALAVAEELHRGADDLVALLDEERRGDGGVHAPGHRDQHLEACHRRSRRSRCAPSAARRPRTFSTAFA
jgi:hypothetical protein